MSTYHRPLKAKRTVYGGRTYPSRMQARRAAELDLLKQAGEVAWWLPEVTIPLGPDHKYRVDFLVAMWPWTWLGVPSDRPATLKVHAEDTKAIKTRDQARHERMWRKYGPMPLHVITKAGVEVIEREA